KVGDGFGVGVYATEVIAARHGRERAVERKNFQAVARKVEFTNDFGTKERDNVGTFGEKKTGEDFLGDGGAAKNVAAFQDHDLVHRPGKELSVHEPVVAAAEDDHAVVLPHP